MNVMELFVLFELQCNEFFYIMVVMDCSFYQERLQREMNEINLQVVNPTFNEGEAIYTCLELAERCVNMHKDDIKRNCEYDEDFVEELMNDFENSDYCVQMDVMTDQHDKSRCELKYAQILELMLSMFDDDE